MAIEFRIERGWSFDGYQAWIIDHRPGQGTYIAKPIDLVFERIEEVALTPEPSLKIGGPISRELVLAAKKAFAGLTIFNDPDDYEVAKRVEKAMQAHIDSLKFVVERTVKTQTC